ncbi:MAG: hypothetical protein R3F41_01665 [Gammaproteobacteria bacterium]|nr:hypothetical protein [Pseudomonadales bacterium]MCP5345993.1 hypothetical protein [Pseudomonadales bacterium]
MIFASGHSIFWRLTDETGEGSDVVSIVLSNQSRREVAEVEIETDIISPPHQSSEPDTPIDIEWTKSDLDLFLTLLRNTLGEKDNAEEYEQIELDLTDESVLRIMHIVAAARFATPYAADGVVKRSEAVYGGVVEYKVGERISLDTIDGFKPAVIVSLDEAISCVLLEQITAPSGDNIQLDRHDLVVVEKEWVLPGSLTTTQPGATDTIH